jgi:ABC-type antimicrobial peptide transport system permease subunit
MIYRLMDPSAVAGFLIVRAEGETAGLIPGLEATLRELTGSATVVETFTSRLAAMVVAVRRVQTLLLAMGGIALLLAIVGVVATVWADASRRRREFAIRLALGAGPAAVRRQLIATGMWPVHAGVLFGLLLSWSVGKVVEAQHILPLASAAAEPRPYLLVAALFLTTALATLLAVAVPVARRDPLASLRAE